MSISLCRRVLAAHELCDNCLGRQFAQLSTGMTNAERGRIIRDIFGEEKGISLQEKRNRNNRKGTKAKAKTSNPSGGIDASPRTRCDVCGGFFSGIQRWVDEAAGKLKPYEYSTFAVGTKPGADIARREEGLWEEIGIEHCEPFRSESNREFGKALWARIRKTVDEASPDILVILDLGAGKIELDVRSVYVKGSYKKLVRGIPQTKWDRYPVTVEDIIAKSFMEKLKGRGHSLHCAGREDIDARCLDWRPFVLEIEQPVKRSVKLKEMEKSINKTGRVEVSKLRFAGRGDVLAVKEMRHDKGYRMLIEFESPPKEDKLAQLGRLVGPIMQQTPTRVMHRRADLLRKRHVKSIRWRKLRGRKYEIRIRGDAGLYAKEFVTGDGGRTKPSVAEFLGVPAKILELDVVKIYIKRTGDALIGKHLKP